MNTNQTTKPDEIIVYWNSTDRANEGWAYRVSHCSPTGPGTMAAGRIADKSFGLCHLEPDAKPSEQIEAVVTIAWHYGIDIDSGSVAYDPANLSATWEAVA